MVHMVPLEKKRVKEYLFVFLYLCLFPLSFALHASLFGHTFK